jgi:hypothetical protein
MNKRQITNTSIYFDINIFRRLCFLIYRSAKIPPIAIQLNLSVSNSLTIISKKIADVKGSEKLLTNKIVDEKIKIIVKKTKKCELQNLINKGQSR